MYKICYWDSEANAQRERDATPDEASEIESRRAAAQIAPIPQSVTRRQGLQALFLEGVTEAMIEAQIDLMPSPQKELALIELRTSQVFERGRPLVVQMGAAFSLDLDALFIKADSLA